jgi:DNA-binding CsgD family transcriptional regulator
MDQLTSHDTRQLFECLLDLYELRDSNSFKRQAVKGLATLVSADLYSYNEISTTQQLVTGYAIWPIEFPLLPDATEILGRYQYQHPTVMHYLTTGERDVTKISDFMSYREFRRTDLYNEFYRPMGIPYGVGFGISIAQDGLIGVGLHRSGRDYSERDRRILSELTPHILQAYANAQVVTRLQHETAARFGAFDALESAVVCLSSRLTIHWMTPEAERLLLAYRLISSRHRDRLHRTVFEWLRLQERAWSVSTNVPKAPRPLIVHGPSGKVILRLIRQGAFCLLIPEELRSVPSTSDLANLGLSWRETDVLRWVAQGKTNSEIGTILGISLRTVQKHLERVYSRLGVENRHAAMTIAMATRRRGHHLDIKASSDSSSFSAGAPESV